MIRIKPTSSQHLSEICNIYNHYINHTCYTFEEVEWTIKDIEHKFLNITDANYPFFTCFDGDKIVGYYYLSSWNFRSAYNTTAEVTIYLHPESIGKGYGKAMYSHLIKNIDNTRFHSIIACITIPNEASVALHEKFGFKKVSFFPEIGYKHSRWCDVGHWQLILR